MDDSLIPAYVSTAAALARIPLDAGRLERVAAHLQRTADMARLLEGAALEPHGEPAEIYSPAAFQPNKNKHEKL